MSGADAEAASATERACGEAPRRWTALRDALTAAAATIAPSWPLDQAVGVNPHWYRVDQPIRRVAARLAVLRDFRIFPSRDYIGSAWHSGRITRADLEAARGELVTAPSLKLGVEQCVRALSLPLAIRRMPLLDDVLDDPARRDRHWPWEAAIVFQLSQMCATYFDRHQADWRAAGSTSLYGFWRESIGGDHGVSSMLGLPHLATQIHALPPTANEAARWAMERLALPESAWESYFEALLLSINGWASWCSYVHWQNLPAGKDDPRVRELLVCRLAWEALLVGSVDAAAGRKALAALAAAWHGLDRAIAGAEEELLVDEVWQRALEIGYQRALRAKLRAEPAVPAAEQVEAQAVFCIDTRSERMRRALEFLSPHVETRAYAGFFGIPLAYNPLGTEVHRPQLPGLAYPSVGVADVIVAPRAEDGAEGDATQRARRSRWARLATADQWLATVKWSSTTFSFVEAAGVGYLGKIWRWMAPSGAPRVGDDRIGLSPRDQPYCRPVVVGLDGRARVELAAGVLHTMGLDDRLAPLVVLCGHASHSTNNAHASTLDCGACYGRPGEANARALASLLNDAAVRSGLASKGLHIPAQTVFMAALHNTTTDEVTAFDLDLLPPAALARWQKLAALLEQAGDRIRRERAPALAVDDSLEASALLRAYRRRSNDGAQTRPEWGLTRNATFLIGPRSRSRGRVLSRCYLHDYDARYDRDGSVLEKLMVGPMLVCHWLSWQYHASTCDPLHYGAGNKVLHNVVGGHLGVFEGNGGDLRIGLPKQSLHNDAGWYHEPVRLTVIIDAPAASIANAVARNPILGQILDNGWMLLWRYEGDDLQRYTWGSWVPLD
ncbi:MAG TPA: DUF2309 domain-containing protein [Nevskiaceae bacterium]